MRTNVIIVFIYNDKAAVFLRCWSEHSTLIVADWIQALEIIAQTEGAKGWKTASWCSLLEVLTLILPNISHTSHFLHPDPHNPTAVRINLNNPEDAFWFFFWVFDSLAKTAVFCLSAVWPSLLFHLSQLQRQTAYTAAVQRERKKISTSPSLVVLYVCVGTTT